MRRKKEDNTGIIMLVFLVGVPLYLLMEHPLIFWLVLVPLVVLGVTKFIKWLKK